MLAISAMTSACRIALDGPQLPKVHSSCVLCNAPTTSERLRSECRQSETVHAVDPGSRTSRPADSSAMKGPYRSEAPVAPVRQVAKPARHSLALHVYEQEAVTVRGLRDLGEPLRSQRRDG
jgi:hypothetical protein